MLTGTEDRTKDRNIITENVDVGEGVFLKIDKVLEDCLEAIRRIVVGHTLVGAELLEYCLKTENITVEAGESLCRLLLKVIIIVLHGRRTRCKVLCA
jgi:hypothetical protein